MMEDILGKRRIQRRTRREISGCQGEGSLDSLLGQKNFFL